ncbi:MAG: hypothetical protein HQK82_13500 [Desulfovibrionaceae bacterium]|nr:hypothetical protein [Desulfovibrionaceae bacterium]
MQGSHAYAHNVVVCYQFHPPVEYDDSCSFLNVDILKNCIKNTQRYRKKLEIMRPAFATEKAKRICDDAMGWCYNAVLYLEKIVKNIEMVQKNLSP